MEEASLESSSEINDGAWCLRTQLGAMEKVNTKDFLIRALSLRGASQLKQHWLKEGNAAEDPEILDWEYELDQKSIS